jgi:hypothetical protein
LYGASHPDKIAVKADLSLNGGFWWTDGGTQRVFSNTINGAASSGTLEF